jgi:hypothetical protein
LHDLDERRVHPRMKARWPVTILTERGLVQGETVNVSATGAFVKCRGEFHKSEVYWMFIGLDRQSVVINGKALWLERDTGRETAQVTGLGVMFEM